MPGTPSGGSGSGFFHWIAHTALPFAVHHWRQGLEIAGMGVCTFMSAGLCLIAGGIYTAANWAADSIDTGSPFTRKSLTDLAINATTTLVYGYSGKVVSGALASTSAEETNAAFNFVRGWNATPYIPARLGIFGPFGGGLDHMFTGIALGVNAIHSAAQCYSSFSSPCD